MLLALSGCSDDSGLAEPVASVTVLPEHPSISIGSSVQLTATAFDAAGDPISTAAVRWEVDDALVASVSASGMVTGIAIGSTTVTATIGGQEGRAALDVTARVASIALDPDILKVAPGRLGRLRATLSDDFGDPVLGPTVTWSSSEPAIAGVDAAGVVTGGAPGSATITASADGQSATADVTVNPVFEIASLTITPTSATVSVGDTVRLDVVARNARGETLPGRRVVWTSLTADLATVSPEGVVRGQRTGQATITASADGFTAQTTVTVLPPLISLRAVRRRGEQPV